jgi:hypothetical protein
MFDFISILHDVAALAALGDQDKWADNAERQLQRCLNTAASTE